MKYNLVIIGAGPGGYVAAVRAAQMGRTVAVVEREAVGGVCLNKGCIPTKALLKSAQVLNYCRHAAAYGVSAEGEFAPDTARMVARAQEVSASMRKGIEFLFKQHGITLVEGSARIAARGRVEVGDRILECDDILIATGARPREMLFMPIDGVHVISSQEALRLVSLPESMIVVGSGAIGSEFAYLYATLGVKVTVVEYLPALMPLCDEEVSKEMERAFRKARISVMTGTTVRAVEITPDGRCAVTVEGRKGVETLAADVVLSAVGIKSNIEDLGLEAVGVQIERDKIKVDSAFRTSVEGIYAIGDVIATPALAHVASAEGTACVERMYGSAGRVDYGVIPSCIFTVPEVAQVGVTEQSLRERGEQYGIGRFRFMASGKAAAAGERDGFVKLIFDAERRLVGAHIVGAGASDMIEEAAVAVSQRMTAADIASVVHPHPSMCEGIMEAAKDFEINR